MRLTKGVRLGGHDQSVAPSPPKRYVYWAQLAFLDVLRDNAKTGDQFEAFIATRANVGAYFAPLTPAMNAREYFVAIFTNADTKLQLLGLPASQSELEKWEAEVVKYVAARDHLRIQ